MPILRQREAGKGECIFISYAREDSAAAEKLYNDLKRHGYNPWLDVYDILPGQQWKIAIEDAIKGSSFFIALVSTNSITKRGFAQRELRRALDVLDELTDDAIFIIPVRLDNCRPSLRKLQEINWVDLFQSYDSGLERILKAIEAHSISSAILPEPEELPIDDDKPEHHGEEAEEVSDESHDAYLASLRDRVDYVDGIRIEKDKDTDTAYVGTSSRYIKLTRSVLQYFDKHSFGKVVFRGSLIELSDDIAGHLSNLKCSELVIEPVMNLTPQIAKSLARWEGNYLRVAAETIPWQAVEALVEWKGKKLDLDGLGSLHEEAAQHLGRWQGDCLQLTSVRHLSPEAATLLSKWPGRELKIEGLLELVIDVAKNLARWEGTSLHLANVRKMPAGALDFLIRWPGEKLILEQMRGLTPARVRVISKWPGKHLILSRMGRIGGGVALCLYSWRGEVITLERNDASKSARFYLGQWGTISGSFSKWGSVSIKRKGDLPSRPERFGVLPTFLEVYRTDLPGTRPSAGPSQKQIKPELIKSKVYRNASQASRRHLALTVFALALVIFLLALAAKADFMKATLSFLHAGESLFNPAPSFGEGTLRLIRLIARLLLALIVPIVLGFLMLASYALYDEMGPFDRLPGELKKALEGKFDGEMALIAILGIVPFTLYFIHIIFPDSLAGLRDLFIGLSRDGVDGFSSGAWHGIISPARATYVGYPPQSNMNSGWLFYYPGYIIGAFIGMFGLMFTPSFILWALLGFNSKRRDIAVKKLRERSQVSIFTSIWILTCVFWFVAVVAGIWI